jgi:hypothetical protein
MKRPATPVNDTKLFYLRLGTRARTPAVSRSDHRFPRLTRRAYSNLVERRVFKEEGTTQPTVE